MPISRRKFLKRGAAVATAGLAGSLGRPSGALAAARPSHAGPFQPTWESLAQYRTPEWYRDAKFGIWAHWGPSCQAARGDWFARNMYFQGGGDSDYQFNLKKYGHPSKSGFKDICHDWKAENWDPHHLMGLYKKAGAKYFQCLANFHDNFDNWDSTYQPWNSVAVGPKKDLVGGWEKAARAAGLRFAVSSHAAHAWSWYEPSQGADKTGPLAGVPYDGVLTKADGKGQWWEGLDPQELYAQAHTPSRGFEDSGMIHSQWDWGNGASIPSAAYIQKFYNRTIDLVDKYHPDVLYFDDTVLPLYPISDIGLRITAHLYNTNMQRHGGRLEAVVNGKILNEQQRRCMVWDLERGVTNEIEPLPWQTDTCIGDWHYSLDLYERHGYKTPFQVAHMLVDIVSKNGNLMLNIPVRGDGTIDPDEEKFLADFTKWMNVSGEGIYGTRPWKVAVEGPAGSGPAIHAQGFNETNRAYTARDFRFTAMPKGDGIYAFAMAWPEDGKLTIRSLARGAGRVEDVRLLGHPGQLAWTQTADGLVATLPAQKPCDYVYGLRIRGRGLTPVPVGPSAPVVVEPRAGGVIVLRAVDATIHGDSPVLEVKADVNDIGYWGNPQDTVSWELDVTSPGRYTATINASCAPGSAGGKFTLVTPGQSLDGTLTSSGSWETFAEMPVGVLTLSQAGKQTLTFQPQSTPPWKAIALRSVTLTKIP